VRATIAESPAQPEPSRRSVQTVVVMPAGPADDIFDTLDSVLAYVAAPRAIVVVDDTGSAETNQRLKALHPDVHVIAAPRGAEGGYGGLLLKIGAGYEYARGHFDFEVLIRFDADALFLAEGAEAQAIRRFAEDPGVGLLGSYRLMFDGTPRDFSPVVSLLSRELKWGWLRHPRLWLSLVRYLRRARSHGYEPGEHCLGATYVHSPAAVAALVDGGHLTRPEFAASRLGEDHLMAMLTVACGYRLGDFATGDQPLAVRWQGLPDSPDRLLASGKAIVHSVRYWHDMDEGEVRAAFADARRGDPSATG
jgi:hypothetical protein